MREVVPSLTFVTTVNNAWLVAPRISVTAKPGEDVLFLSCHQLLQSLLDTIIVAALVLAMNEWIFRNDERAEAHGIMGL